MKYDVVAYTPLHYGRDYLAYAIDSVIDAVDVYYVLYTAEGSHGHRSPIRCPETRDELYAIAEKSAGKKLRWIDGSWPYEGAQRDTIHALRPDANVILALDADEIWPAATVEAALRPSPYWHTRLPMIHFWRSFYRAVLHDPAFPVRVIRQQGKGETTLSAAPICHMGYAQRSEIVEYKQHVHGHKGEWRRDCDWFRERFMANAQVDCHPVGSEYWNPERITPTDYLPDFMMSHPYAHTEVIP